MFACISLEQLVQKLLLDDLALQKLVQELFNASNLGQRGLLHKLDEVLRLVAGVEGCLEVQSLVSVNDRASNLLIA